MTGENLLRKTFSFLILTAMLCATFGVAAEQPRAALAFGDRRAENRAGGAADVQIPNCPDADGIIRGTARASGLPVAGAKGGLSVEANIVGYVNDAAELMHFDVSGAATEIAAQRGTFSVEESKIAADGAGAGGATRGRTMITVAPNADAANAERYDREIRGAVAALVEQTAAKLAAARREWRGGACVEVKISAAKTRLAAGERVIVAAESRHKLEKTAFAAKLSVKEATASATPGEQRGAPTARFTLTAPRDGAKALLVVESVSKRGIGTGRIEFEANAVVARKPPAGKTPPSKTVPQRAGKCGAWTGKITAVKQKKKEMSKPASGRLLRHIESEDETFHVEYRLLGIADTSQGLTNAYLADAKLNFNSKRYTEDFYAAGKTSCDKRIITTTELRTMEIVMNASSEKQLTVYITSRGEKGHLTMNSPETRAKRIITRKYETACPSYDRVNSGVDRGDGLIEIVSPDLEIEFELDAKSDSQLNGSKTVQNSDGSQTVVTWNLTRECK